MRNMTGIVRLKLYKGNVIVASRKSPKSLYDPEIATMEGDASAYDQGDATGFIRLNALRLKIRAALKSKAIDPIARSLKRLELYRRSWPSAFDLDAPAKDEMIASSDHKRIKHVGRDQEGDRA
jgi:Arginosuccinate synthase